MMSATPHSCFPGPLLGALDPLSRFSELARGPASQGQGQLSPHLVNGSTSTKDEAGGGRDASFSPAGAAALLLTPGDPQ